MVGIVGILLLGSLAWSAVGALVSAVGSAASALSSSNAPPAPTLGPARAVTPTSAAVVAPVAATPTTLATPAPTVTVAPTPQPASTPTPAPSGRNPWILLPQPEPGARVNSGQVTIEARGRGDAPITALRLELDGSPLNVSLEQRAESTWRGFATVRVDPGQHSVRASVTDAEGRAGSFRWTFSAAASAAP